MSNTKSRGNSFKDRNGQKVQYFHIKTREECQRRCQLWSQCEYYVLDIDKERCNLKTDGAQHNIETHITYNFVFGKKQC